MAAICSDKSKFELRFASKRVQTSRFFLTFWSLETWKIAMLLIGKSWKHIYFILFLWAMAFMAMLNNQRVYIYIYIYIYPESKYATHRHNVILATISSTIRFSEKLLKGMFRIPQNELVGCIPAPLKNMSSSVGMMKFPIYGNHRPCGGRVPNSCSDNKNEVIWVVIVISWLKSTYIGAS